MKTFARCSILQARTYVRASRD